MYIIFLFMLSACPTEIYSNGDTVRPGLRARVTRGGLQYGADVGVDFLMREVQEMQIPDIIATASVGTLSVNNVMIVDFTRPTVELFPVPDYGSALTIQDVALIINADFTLDAKLAFLSLTREGRIQAEASDLSITLQFLIGRSHEGRPMLYGLECSAEGDNIDIDFGGDWSTILNFVFDTFRSKIRSAIKAQVCAKAKEEINKQFSAAVATFPTSATVLEDYEIDYRMVLFPEFTTDYMDVDIKGAVYWKSSPEEPGFLPPVIPTYPDQTSRMVYFYLTDYLVNTGFLAAYVSGRLSYNISTDMIPEDARQYLTTTCPRSICIGTIFPQLAEAYPGAMAEIDILAISPPVASFNGNEINVMGRGEARFYIRYDGERIPMFTVSMNISGGVEVGIFDGKLLFNLTAIDPDATIKESSIGEVGAGFLFEALIRVAAQQVLRPKIEEYGTRGFPLPTLKGVQFVNSEIIDHGTENVFIASTDIIYNPEE